ncbi:MAG: extracellular solute-binding protein [Oscillospiraceae bacterium]|nr:extracellular solute-binding protein [Oscillospiraceae bacterium]
MKKALSILLAATMLAVLLAACGGGGDGGGGTATPPPSNNTPSGGGDTPSGGGGGGEEPSAPSPYEAEGLYWNEETGTWRFTDTRKISVEVFDRGLEDDRTKPEDCHWSKWIEEGVKRDLNLEIEWLTVPRFAGGGEAEIIVSMLAANDAPNVCYTYNHDAITEFGARGGVLDLIPYVDGYRDLLPNLWGLLGEDAVYAARDPEEGHLYWLEAVLFNNARIGTFVREDWLNKLGRSAPTTTQEFEDMLVAFKDNAELLLGADANMLIPFTMSDDVGWRANNLFVSFVPDAITDKELYINGYDDRQFMLPGYKEGVRLLSKWYDMGLVWQDFSTRGAPGETFEDNNMKAGLAGAFIGNWDYVYRQGDKSIQETMKAESTAEAAFIAVDCFQNDAGKYRKFISSRVGDRKIFLPYNNPEPLASMLYVDWVSRDDVRKYLQIGEEGINHDVMDNGAIVIKSAAGTPYIQNGPFNIDYTITFNGSGQIDAIDPVISGLSMALGFAPIDPSYIARAFEYAINDGRIAPRPNFGAIEAESGMANPLKSKRDTLLNQVVNAPLADFDSIWDAGWRDYLNSGGQDIIDERTAKYEKYIG